MSATPEDDPEDFRLDRTQFSIARLTDPDDAVRYWMSRPVEERLRALELLRRTFSPAAKHKMTFENFTRRTISHGSIESRETFFDWPNNFPRSIAARLV